MDCWSRGANMTYKRWRNTEQSSQADLADHSDEDQTDNEIYTIGSPRIDSEGIQSACRSGFDQTQVTFTVDDALETIGFGKFQWKMSVLIILAWVGDAMEMMILSILGPQLQCDWGLPSYQVALITSVVFIGIIIGAPILGNVSDRYGRKTGLMISIGWALFYGLLSAFTPVYGWLLVLRGLVGFGIAGSSQMITLYSEFLPVKSRGIAIIVVSGFWGLGSVLEVLLALLVMPTLSWRWLLGLSTIPLAIFVCFSFWLPESARFNVLTGQTEKAMATLRRIAKENGKAMPQGKLIAYKQDDRGQIKDLLSPPFCRTTLLLWLIWFANAFCYYGIVLLTTELFQNDLCDTTEGDTAEPSCNLACKYLTTADYEDLLWTTLAEFPAIFSFLAIDRIGRKKSMALFFFVFFLSILPMYACIGRTAVTICIFIARVSITGGYHIVYLYTPEVYPTENRALAMGTSSAISSIGSLIAPFVAQVLLETSLYVALSLFCGISLLSSIASLILPMETSGRRMHLGK